MTSKYGPGVEIRATGDASTRSFYVVGPIYILLRAGSIPPELGTLTALTRLDLRENQLVGEDPALSARITMASGVCVLLTMSHRSGTILGEVGTVVHTITCPVSCASDAGFWRGGLGRLAAGSHTGTSGMRCVEMYHFFSGFLWMLLHERWHRLSDRNGPWSTISRRKHICFSPRPRFTRRIHRMSPQYMLNVDSTGMREPVVESRAASGQRRKAFTHLHPIS